MNPGLRPRDTRHRNLRPAYQGRILRLVKNDTDRRALQAGEIDAVLDPTTRTALLLPEAQAALQDGSARLRSLLALSADWFWEQDENYRFVAHTGIAEGNSGTWDEQIIGKTLRELQFENLSEADWLGHGCLLEWRVSFRELELQGTDRAGELRWISISGEPVFDDQDRFRGYRGIMRDITSRKQTEALQQKSWRTAWDALSSLAGQVYLLDPAGIVVMSNRSAGVIVTAGNGIGADFPDGASFLGQCDAARGRERADGLAIAAGIRQVIAGESPSFHHEYVSDSPAGRCWFDLTAMPFSGAGATRVVVLRENISLRDHGAPPPGAGREEILRDEPIANSLLAALPDWDYQCLRADLEPVALAHGDVLFEPGAPIRHVYFPNDCLVSLLATAAGHESLEFGLVGRDGMVGIAVPLGADKSSKRALVQGAGTAMRMDAGRFRQHFQRSAPLRFELYRYIHALMAQIAQTLACNNFHRVEARLARWLLMTRDRTKSRKFRLTQKFLSEMLGVRRVGVTLAAGALQQRKLIRYSRGCIEILDRRGLEAASCPCYRKIKTLTF